MTFKYILSLYYLLMDDYFLGQFVGLSSLAIFLFLKGRNIWGIASILGFLFIGIGGFPWLVLSFRLAHPKSFWAKKFYSETKLKLSEERFENSKMLLSPK